MKQQYAILADRTFTPEGIRYQQYVRVCNGVIQEITDTAPNTAQSSVLKGAPYYRGLLISIFMVVLAQTSWMQANKGCKPSLMH